MRLNALLLATAAAALTACASAAQHTPAAPASGEALVRMMHDRYAGRWYNTLSFTQKTTRRMPNSDSVRVDTWVEYGAMPGRLRIEMGPRENNNGAIYANDSVYAIRGGNVAVRRAQRNALMILGFDVYALAPGRSVAILREEGFPMTPIRTDTWQGRRVYVVGGAPGDLHSKQFWVDAERLLYVRSLEPFQGDTTKTLDIRFDDYRPFGGGWVAAMVDILVDGQSIQKEEYSDIKVNVPMDPSLWIPERWSTAVHPN